MGRLEQFLLNTNIDTVNETDVIISKRFVDEEGKYIPFRIRTITEAEHKAIKKACQVTSFNKIHQKQVETDQALYGSRMIVACTVDPNFKSAELQESKGVMGAEALVEKLLLPGEHNELLLAILRFNGFDEDINQQVEEAKN